MLKVSRFLAMPLALTIALSVGACRDRNDNALGEDTTLSRDLQMANAGDTAAQPQLQDVPPASQPAPAAPRPKPSSTKPTSKPSNPAPSTPKPTTTASGNTETHAASGSEARVGTIAAGTNIQLASGARVCTNTHKAGDRFTATVSQAVTGSNGVVIPAGAKAVVQVTSVDNSDNANEPIKMGFVVQSVTFDGKTYPIDGAITDVQVERVRTTTKGSDAKKVIGGAVAGAILGRIIGKDTKSTVIGAATGAAAGTAVAMGTGDYAGCLPEGGNITVKLNTPAQIQVAD
ncbi:MAG TPA: hypothetical protein VFK13_04505 [Gemmatimonadaceae bacterium]|nr:hypothetical protein [Gemmatimonadaceae bacterium]